MAKLEDFLDVKFVELTSECDEYELLKSDYYLVKMKDNYDNILCNGYNIGVFNVKVNGGEYLDLTDKDCYSLQDGNLFYKDIYKKGHDLYFMSNDGVIEVDDIEDIISEIIQIKTKLLS